MKDLRATNLPKEGQSLRAVAPKMGRIDEEVSIPLTVTVREDNFFDGTKQDYTFFTICAMDASFLNDPYAPKEFRLAPKWKRDKDRFAYNARIRLAEAPDFTMTGECYAYRYYNKKRRKMVTYAKLAMDNPFIDSEYPLEFMIKDEGQAALFADLVSPLLTESIEVDVVEDEATDKGSV